MILHGREVKPGDRLLSRGYGPVTVTKVGDGAYLDYLVHAQAENGCLHKWWGRASLSDLSWPEEGKV